MSMSTTVTNVQWNFLTTFSFHDENVGPVNEKLYEHDKFDNDMSRIIIPIGNDTNNFIAIDVWMWTRVIKNILQYNVTKNEWAYISSLDKIIPQNKCYTSLIDSPKNILYLIHRNKINTIHLDDAEIKCYDFPKGVSLTPSKIAFTNEHIFIIGQFPHHIWKWNFETKLLTQIKITQYKQNIEGFGMISHNNNKLIFFGGYNKFELSDDINVYHINNNKWTSAPCKLPHKRAELATTMVMKDTIILLFGGRNDFWQTCDNIYIYSIKHQTIRESQIKMPTNAICECVTINDGEHTESVLTFGFVRNEWNKCNMYNHMFPPNYIIKLIQSYYIGEEYVILFTSHNKKQYKINALDIIG